MPIPSKHSILFKGSEEDKSAKLQFEREHKLKKHREKLRAELQELSIRITNELPKLQEELKLCLLNKAQNERELKEHIDGGRAYINKVMHQGLSFRDANTGYRNLKFKLEEDKSMIEKQIIELTTKIESLSDKKKKELLINALKPMDEEDSICKDSKTQSITQR